MTKLPPSSFATISAALAAEAARIDADWRVMAARHAWEVASRALNAAEAAEAAAWDAHDETAEGDEVATPTGTAWRKAASDLGCAEADELAAWRAMEAAEAAAAEEVVYRVTVYDDDGEPVRTVEFGTYAEAENFGIWSMTQTGLYNYAIRTVAP